MPAFVAPLPERKTKSICLRGAGKYIYMHSKTGYIFVIVYEEWWWDEEEKKERERMIDRAYKYNGKGISTVEPRFRWWFFTDTCESSIYRAWRIELLKIGQTPEYIYLVCALAFCCEGKQKEEKGKLKYVSDKQTRRWSIFSSNKYEEKGLQDRSRKRERFSSRCKIDQIRSHFSLGKRRK